MFLAIPHELPTSVDVTDKSACQQLFMVRNHSTAKI